MRAVKSLEDVASDARTDVRKHWLVPEVARAGMALRFNGESRAKRLAAAELAVSVATGTKFLNTLPIEMFGRVVFVSDDPIITVTNMMRMLEGRGLKGCPDLQMIPWNYDGEPEGLFDELGAIQDLRLLVLEGELPYAWIDLQFVAQTGRPAVLSIGGQLTNPHEHVMNVTFDKIGERLRLDYSRSFPGTNPSKALIAHAHMQETKEQITWEPLPPDASLSRFQETVFLAVQRLKFATVSEIRKELGMRSNPNLTKALESLKEDGYLQVEKQAMGMGEKSINIWSTNV